MLRQIYRRNIYEKTLKIFFRGQSWVNSNGKIGYINKEGRLTINAIYQNGTRFSEGLAFVLTDDDKFLCINTDGKTKFELDGNVNNVGIFCNSIALVVKDGKTGYIKPDGSDAFDSKFDAGYYLNREGLLGAIQDNKYGFCDLKGNMVINPQFNNANDFSEGLCAVSDGSKWGFIDKDGKFVINPQFEEAANFSDGLCRIKQGGKYGFIDKKGKIVINPQFGNGCWDFKDGLCSVNQNDKFGYIDKDGKFVINPQFEGATPFYGELAIVVSNGQIGLINKQGKYEINPQFDNISFPDRFQRFIAQTKTAGSTAPRMSFNEAVFQNRTSEAGSIGKKISAAKKVNNPKYNGYYVTYPANVNIKEVKEAYNFWQTDRDVKKGNNTSAIIKSAGIVLKFDNNVSTDDIDKLIDEFIEYVCYEKELFDADEFGPNFGHGITQYGHHNAWVFNSKKYLSYFVDRDDVTVTVYTSYDGRYLDNFMQKMFREIKKDLDGENFENIF
ncbi:MAG: WG repeat-containing protein [Bacteroidales bacterium]|nr:WG repeat-containing protein [Bacteroidales bacterium]